MFQQEQFFWRFGDFSLNPAEQILLRNGSPIQVTAKSFSLLVLLVEAHGTLVDRETLISRLWPDITVEENNLKVQVSVLRRTLGDSFEQPKFIETIPKRGYRFIAQVTRVEAAELAETAPVEKAVPSTPPDPPPCPDKVTAAEGRFPAFGIPFRLFPLGLLILALLAFFWKSNGSPHRKVDKDIQSIAVLPFSFHPENDETSFLGVGLSDLLIARFGSIQGMTVRPADAVRRFGTMGPDPVKVGRDLRVDAVLGGEIHRSGEKYKIAVNFIRVSDGKKIWGGNFERTGADLFSFPDWLTGQLVAAAGQSPVSEPVRKPGQKNAAPEIMSNYLKGRFLMNRRTREDSELALTYFQEAVRVDPNYAPAWSGVADALLILGDYGWRPLRPSWEEARSAAARAIALDPGLAEARATMGYLKFFCDWDSVGGEKEFLEAVRLNPNYVTAHQWYSQFLAISGRHDEAIREAGEGVRIDPASPLLNMQLGAAFYYARRYPEAIRQLKATLDLDSKCVPAISYLGQAQEENGQLVESETTLKRMNGLIDDKIVQAMVAHVRAKNGDPDYGRRVLRLFPKPVPGESRNLFIQALILVGLGEKDRALTFLEKAFEEKSVALLYLKIDPRFEPLRGEERYRKLIDQVWLPVKQG